MTRVERIAEWMPSPSSQGFEADREHGHGRFKPVNPGLPKFCSLEEAAIHDLLWSAKLPDLFCKGGFAEQMRRLCKTDEQPLQKCWKGPVSSEGLLVGLIEKSVGGVCLHLLPLCWFHLEWIGGEQ